MKVKDFLALVRENETVVLFERSRGYEDLIANTLTATTMTAGEWRQLGLFDNRTIELIEAVQDGLIGVTLEALNDD